MSSEDKFEKHSPHSNHSVALAILAVHGYTPSCFLSLLANSCFFSLIPVAQIFIHFKMQSYSQTSFSKSMSPFMDCDLFKIRYLSSSFIYGDFSSVQTLHCLVCVHISSPSSLILSIATCSEKPFSPSDYPNGHMASILLRKIRRK